MERLVRCRVAIAALWMFLMLPFPLQAENETVGIGGSEILSDINISDLLKPSPRPERSTRTSDPKEDSLDGRDPFYLPGAKEEGDPLPENGEWRLTAIIYGDREGVAIVNGAILREGDWIRGLRVKKIQKDRVLLVGGNQSVELKVRQFIIK